MDKYKAITDEEVEHFKDFDALVTKHKLIQRNNLSLTGKILLFSMLVLIGLLCFVFYFQRDYTIEKNPRNLTDIVIDSAKFIDKKIQKDTFISYENDNSQKKEKLLNRKTNSKKENESQIPISTPVYKQAEPINGFSHLYNYFNSELVYPSEALKDSIQGVIVVSFTINEDGIPEDLKFSNSLGRPFEEEATRLINNMPPWKPATLDNKPIISRLSLPLTFQIVTIKKVN